MEEKDATIQAQNEELQKYRDQDLKKENRKKFRKLQEQVAHFS